jgi:hypothetical protein
MGNRTYGKKARKNFKLLSYNIKLFKKKTIIKA